MALLIRGVKRISMAKKEKQSKKATQERNLSNYSVIHLLINIYYSIHYVPDIGNIARNQSHNLTDKTHKHVITSKCSDIGKAVDATGTCNRSTSPNEGVKQSLWRKRHLIQT